MRSELVFTHFRCNQHCGYCTVRRSSDEPAFIQRAAVQNRIREAISRGARELVLSGGEPTMREDLEQLIGFAKSTGAERIVLETNGTLLSDQRVERLVRAGLSAVRLNLTAWGPQLDTITRDQGGFLRTLEGLRAVLAHGVTVTLCAVLVEATRHHLVNLPQKLEENLGNLQHIQQLLIKVPTELPDPQEQVSYPHAVDVLSALDGEARRVGLIVKIAPDSGPPPCLFKPTGRTTQLFAMTPGHKPRDNHLHPDVCNSCQMRRSCTGISAAYVERFGLPVMHPITEDRVRRRLSLIATVEEQVRRELSQANRYPDRTTGKPVIEQLIRINFHCNQACEFCFVSTHLPPATDAAIREEITKAASSGLNVTLTGGEPTLNPRLVEYVALARELGAPLVSLQTNATRLAQGNLTEQLVAAGMRWVQVSLHGSYAELSDQVTEAPGTFVQTVQGIDVLHGFHEVYLSINFVITQANYTDLPAFVELVSQRWPRAFLNISFVGPSSDVVPREKRLIPQYSTVLPTLSIALRRAHDLGLDVGGFESMCGLPLCLVPSSDRPSVMNFSEIPTNWDGGEFVHPEACGTCTLKTRCYGLRRGYLDLYGTHEISPIHST